MPSRKLCGPDNGPVATRVCVPPPPPVSKSQHDKVTVTHTSNRQAGKIHVRTWRKLRTSDTGVSRWPVGLVAGHQTSY